MSRGGYRLAALGSVLLLIAGGACVGRETLAWPAFCGNDRIDPGEECDDGGRENGDGCSAACLLEPAEFDCFDGLDNDGDGLIDCEDPDCPWPPEGCWTCGNGLLEPGEQCDDGNQVPGDGCSEFCLLEEICDNGIDDNFDGLIDCEDPSCGFLDPAAGFCTPLCGNGLLEPGEQCDDGNQFPGDGCNESCVLEELCDNGIDDNFDGLVDCQDPLCEGFPCAGGAGLCLNTSCEPI